MNNKIKAILFSLVMIIGLFSFQSALPAHAASTYADGEYSLPFTILKGDSDESSMTNDYVTSPAKLFVEGGKNTVQITINNSSWWQYFKINGADVTTVSENKDADTKVVKFTVQDLDQIVPSNIHVIVPDIDYDNHYDIRFKFDTSGLPGGGGGDAGADGNDEKNNDSEETGTKKTEENPPTGDDAPIILLILILVGSGVFLVRRLAVR